MSAPILPRCIRAVCLSDAFCFLLLARCPAAVMLVSSLHLRNAAGRRSRLPLIIYKSLEGVPREVVLALSAVVDEEGEEAR